MKELDTPLYKFKNEEKLLEHFDKHASQLKNLLGYSNYLIEQYVSDANYVLKTGTYVKEKNAFIKFICGDKYAFVGLDSEANITTFHVKNVEWLKKFAPSVGIE